MGYLRPTAIIVTGSYGNHVQRAHNEALRIFANVTAVVDRGPGAGLVTELLEPAVNGTQSFLVAWDGSKEGWGTSDNGDAARAEFVSWLRGKPLYWVEIQYGGDDARAIVLAHDGDSHDD